MKHTPGPWFIVESRDDEHMHAICHDNDRASPLAYVGTHKTREAKDANAALIAAAPSLADALYFALEEEDGISGSEVCDDIEGCGCWPSVARAALRAAGRLPEEAPAAPSPLSPKTGGAP